MTESRPTADTITNGELDALYRKLAVAEQAATGERTFKWYADDAQRRVKVQRERAEQAEAAIDRVRARHTRGPDGRCTYCLFDYWPCVTICLLDGPPCGPDCEEWHEPVEKPGPAATEATDRRDCPPCDAGVEHTELRERCEATVRMILAGTGAHTVNEWAEYVTAAVLPIFTCRIDELRRERDLAIAHDRQPYPTAWAYEQACTALHKHRDRAEQLASALGEAIAAFSTTAREQPGGCPIGHYAAAPIHPDDMARWRAALDQPKEQPMPTTDTSCNATIEGVNVPDDETLTCTVKDITRHPVHHVGPKRAYGQVLWNDHHAGATPHQTSKEHRDA